MADATMTLNMSAREMAALTELAERHDMSKTQVMRQALALYQLINVRIRAGERLYFSGDEKRAIEFVGLGFEP
jgi:predicted transcriptional regulator